MADGPVHDHQCGLEEQLPAAAKAFMLSPQVYLSKVELMCCMPVHLGALWPLMCFAFSLESEPICLQAGQKQGIEKLL